MALPRGAASSAVAPVDVTAALRRVTGTWSQPQGWTVALLLATGVVVIARHPLAKMIGTEADPAPVVPAVVATAPPAVTGTGPSAAAAAAVPAAPTHAPRDPFRALVSAGAGVLAPPAAAAAAPAAEAPASTASPRHASAPPAPVTASCTGTTHRVVPGDTLWALAARAVKSADTGTVTVAWHRIYSANRTQVGPDPSLLPVGATLCIPASL